jgi:hypothetical protein
MAEQPKPPGRPRRSPPGERRPTTARGGDEAEAEAWLKAMESAEPADRDEVIQAMLEAAEQGIDPAALADLLPDQDAD